MSGLASQRNQRMFGLVCLAILGYMGKVEAKPVTSCPANVVVFIADDTDQCMYHQCTQGAVDLSLRCPAGTVVPHRLTYTTDLTAVCRRSKNPNACELMSASDEQIYKLPVLNPIELRLKGAEENDVMPKRVNGSSVNQKLAEDYMPSKDGAVVKDKDLGSGNVDKDMTSFHKIEDILSPAQNGQKQLSDNDVTYDSTTRPPLDTTGYEVHIENYHVFGGKLIAQEVTLPQCLNLCMYSGPCLGVDYTRFGGLCYTHSTYSICNPATKLPGTVHFKKIQCSGATSHIREIHASKHILGGKLYCSACTAFACISACNRHSRCLSADYNKRYSTCHLHSSLTGCAALIEKDGCTHYKRASCLSPPQLSGPPPLTPVKPVYNPIVYTCPHPCVPPTDATDEYEALYLPVRRPSPSVLPSNWAAYPAARRGTGGKVETDKTGNGCFATCLGDPACHGADFDSTTGYCYLISQEEICGPLIIEGSSTWYHVKKLPCNRQKYNPVKCACA